MGHTAAAEAAAAEQGAAAAALSGGRQKQLKQRAVAAAHQVTAATMFGLCAVRCVRDSPPMPPLWQARIATCSIV